MLKLFLCCRGFNCQLQWQPSGTQNILRYAPSGLCSVSGKQKNQTKGVLQHSFSGGVNCHICTEFCWGGWQGVGFSSFGLIYATEPAWELLPKSAQCCAPGDPADQCGALGGWWLLDPASGQDPQDSSCSVAGTASQQVPAVPGSAAHQAAAVTHRRKPLWY